MTMETIGLVALFLVNLVILLKSKLSEDRLIQANETICEQWIADREKWNAERQQLLDRIQAPSFDHLKHHEAKIIKAQKEQPKETNNLEVV